MSKGGSNDLNLLLKAKVVKLKVELDYKNSKLSTQVNNISKFLENKPVKLKVELHATTADLNKQIKKISETLQNAKSFKPMKIGVEINAQGSMVKIKDQLKEINKVMNDFAKNYVKIQNQINQVNQKSQQQAKVNIPTNAGVQNFNNIKQYANQLSEAERQLRSKFSDKAGIFGTTQLKDAQGNLRGFIATLERANGVVEKVRYDWNKDKNQFQVIDRQTLTTTQQNVHRATMMLLDLERELGKTGKQAQQFKRDYQDMLRQSAQGTLTMDSVNAFKTKIKNAQEEVRVQKELNALKREEAKIIRDIKNTTKGTGTKFTNETQSLISQARKAQDMEAIKDIRVALGNLTDKVRTYKQTQKEAETVDKQRQQALKQLTRYLRETHEATGALERANIKAVQQMAQRATTTKQMMAVQKQLNAMYKQEQGIKDVNAREQAMNKLKKTMQEFAKVTGYSGDVIEAKFKQVQGKVGSNLAMIEKEIGYYSKKIQSHNDKIIQQQLNYQKGSVVQGVSGSKIKGLVATGDSQKIKEYLSDVLKLDIATAKLSTNSKGITKITTTLASTGKTAKQVTYEVDQLNGKLKVFDSQDVFNRNANLGFFEQMKIALQRVPVWMASMTAFYGSINGFKSMAQEILKVDEALTQLKRVASSNINIDTIFQGSIDLSKELGNNVHDIMQAVNELSRTYGDFNERQLLAVAKTATLMSNVSDMSADDALRTLVGTMNAFNIVASDSEHIVDALNQVDNDYAISTQQLAEGLQKSSSTAKTFGATMEENIGHITAIGAVTMESGAIIGNSLKTIYSRITTVEGAKDALEGVNVQLYQVGKTGQKEIKPVNQILSDLSEKWRGLSAEQRQNIAVQVAGRYQLSRFLALMNNWETATKATRTALSSQGSAMRENAKHMDSFSARINVLKNSFTEMSLAMGKAFMNSAILGVIEGLKAMAQGATSVIKTFGALPAIVGVLGIIAFKMGAFNGIITSTRAMMSLMKAEFIMASAGARTFGGAMAGAGGALRSLQVLIPTVTAGLRAMWAVVRSMMASTVVGLVFVAIGYGLEKLMAHFEKQKRIAEKVEKANKQLIDSYRNVEGGLENLAKKQADLQSQVDLGVIKEGTDAYNEYVAVTNKLAEKMPSIVKYIDQSGLAHLKENKYIKEQIELAKQLSDEKHRAEKENYKDSLKKELEAYDKKIAKAKELEKLLDEQKKKNGKDKVVYDYEMHQRINVGKEDTTKDQQKTRMEMIQNTQEAQQHIQKIMTLVQTTTMAYLESDKKLKNLTDAGKTTIESMVQVNEELLHIGKNGEELTDNQIKKNADKMLKLGQDLGKFMSDAYEEATKGLEGQPQKIEEVKKSMDSLIKTLPDEFFKMDSLNNVDDLKERFKGVLSVVDQVKGKTGNFDSLTTELQKYGFTADEAKKYVANLSLEYDNATIRQQAMTQAQSEGVDMMQDWVDTAIKAIDLSQQLFNVGDEDVSAMKSHIENLQSLTLAFGNNAKNMDSYKQSVEALSLFTGIPDDIITKDLNYYHNVLDLMGKVELQYDENTGALVNFNKEGLNKSQIAILDKMIKLGKEQGVTYDLMTKKMFRISDGVEMVFDKSGKLVEAVQKTNAEIEKTPAKNGQKEALEETKKSADKTKQAIIDARQEKLFDENDQSANATKTKIQGMTTDIETYKKAVQDAKLEKLFNEVDESGTKQKQKVDNVNKSLDEYKQKVIEAKQQKLWDENTSGGGDSTVAKVDELSKAIQKATDASKVLSTLDSFVSNSTTKVVGLLTNLRDIASSLDNVSNKAGAVQAVNTAIQNMLGAINVAQGQLGGLFLNVTNNANNLLNPIQTATDAVRILSTALVSLSMVNAGGLPQFIQQVGLLSGNLVMASQYSQQTAQAFSASAQAIQAFSSVVSNINSVTSQSFMMLAQAVIQAVQSMIQSYGSVGNASVEAVSKMVSAFSIGASTLVGTISSMTTRMYNAFVDGMNIIVRSAGNLPKRIGDAIRSNMGYVVSAMKTLSDTVSKTKIQATVRQTKVGAYAKGGIVDKMELAWHGEEGPEAIIPLISKRRGRGLELWKQAGERLGVPTGLIDFLKTRASRKSSGGQSFGGAGSFGASSGEGGEGGGGDSGSSGTIVPSKYEGGVNLDGQFQILEMAELQKWNQNETNMTWYQGEVAKQEAIMQRLTKGTLAYRDALKSAIYWNNKDLELAKKEFEVARKRWNEIEARLKQLGDTSKHTEKQREEYNALVQELSTVSSTYNSLQAEIESVTNDIKAKTLEIFTDMIDEVVGKYDTMIQGFADKVDNIDFQINVLDLTEPNNVEDKMNLMIAKSAELNKELSYQQGKMEDMQKRYNEAVRQYGENSDQAKKVMEEYKKAEESYEDSKLAVLQNEKAIRDARGATADESIKQLKDYYGKMKDMADKAYEEQKKILEKEHEEKMDMYDEEVQKINSVYDAKLKTMDAEKEQEDYQAGLDEKNAKKAELVNKIAILSRDNTLEGKKKLAELQSELTDLNKDIAKYQKDRQDELLRKQIEDQKQAQLDAIQAQKDMEQASYDTQVENLDKKKEATDKQYDSIINNEQYWAELKKSFENGDFTGIQEEMKGMQLNLLNMSAGTFDGLSQDFVSFTDSVKDSIKDLFSLDVNNMKYSFDSIYQQMNDLAHAVAIDFTNGVVDSASVSGTTMTTQTSTSTTTPSTNTQTQTQQKSKPQPIYYTVKSGDTLWDIAQAQYGNPLKWTNIASANGITDARKLQIGKKLLIPFRSGGFTGDWVGDDGRLAILHKKEQVFKKEDTRNLLDASKLLRSMKNVLPRVNKTGIASKLATASGITNISYGDIHVTVENGDKKKGKEIAKEIMKGIKKKGRN